MKGFGKHPFCRGSLQPCEGVGPNVMFCCLTVEKTKTKKQNDLSKRKRQSSEKNPCLKLKSEFLQAGHTG